MWAGSVFAITAGIGRYYFVNIAGLGLDGDTVDRVNRTSKALGGFISFLWGTVASLMLYRNKEMAITVDDQPVFEGVVTIVAVANGRYFGGGMCIAPHAVMEDGLFDIVILHSLSKLNLLANLPKVYRGRTWIIPNVLLCAAGRWPFRQKRRS